MKLVLSLKDSLNVDVLISEDGLNVTLLTIYDKGEISNVKDEFI